MSRTEAVLEQINALTPQEREEVVRELLRRRERVARVEAALSRLSGAVRGAWGEGDAQEWIRSERDNDRF